MKKCILLLVTFLPYVGFADNMITIDSTEGAYNLNPYCYHYADKEDHLKINDILSLTEETWAKLSDKGPILGHIAHPQWVKISIINKASTPLNRYLLIPFNDIDYIKPYFISDSAIISLPALGTTLKYSDKTIPDRNYYFPFTLTGSDTTTVYIEFKNNYQSLRAPVFLVSESKGTEISIFNNAIIWFWRGIFIFALIISLILYTFVKRRLFLYYFIFNFGLMLIVGSEIGDFFIIFDIDEYNVIRSIKTLGTIIAFLYFPHFLNALVNISENKPRLWKALFYVVNFNWVGLIFGLLPVLKNHPVMLVFDVYNMLTAIIVFSLQLYLLFVAVRKKTKGALVLFGLYGFYIASIAVSVILPNLGIGKVTIYTYNSLFIGSILEIFTFMFLMGNETFKVYRDKNDLLIKQRDHQREMMLAVVDGQEQERNKLGRDLHDMVGGNLALIKHIIEAYNEDVKTLISRTIQDVRGMSHGLVTPSIQGDEFKDEILQLAENISEANKLKVNVIFHKWPEIKNKETITHIYRILQELLQNAIKHSQATTVFLQFIGDENLLIIYEDNGIGFDFEQQRKKGIGLKNIEYRIKVLESHMSVESSPKSGTSVFIEIPV